MQPRLADDRHSGQAEGRKNFHSVGLAHRIRYIVIPHQDHYWHAGICQPSYTLGKGALPGGIRVTMLIDITRENGQMRAMIQRIFNGIMHRASEVEEAPIQARGDIEPTVIFHTEVHIRQMQQPQRHPRFSPSLMPVEQLIIRAGKKPLSPRGIMRRDGYGVNSQSRLVGLAHRQWVYRPRRSAYAGECLRDALEGDSQGAGAKSALES